MTGLAASKDAQEKTAGKRTTAFVIFLVAAAVRAFFDTLYALKYPHMFTHWGINEAGVIARSLLTSHSYSSPFHDGVGPSSWLAPVYPVIVALVFIFFGIQTQASAVVAIAINALCSSLISVLLYRIGGKLFSARVGKIAGLLWAVSPAVAIMPLVIWDTSVSALLASYAVVLTAGILSSSAQPRVSSCALAGAVWGLAGLSSPACLAPVPFVALLIWQRSKRMNVAVTLVAVTILTLLPWTLRNAAVFHRFIPVRSNFWAEVSYGNLGFENHATGNSMEYQKLGEIAFGDISKQRALNYIRSQPQEFVHKTVRRIGEFWSYPEGGFGLSFYLSLCTLFGLCLMFKAQPWPAAFFAVVLVVYPVPYYVSFVFSRYRYPVEPIMYLSTAFLIDRAGRWLRERRGKLA